MKPEKNKSYALRLPTSLWDHLTAEAGEQGVSVNSLMNLLLAGGRGHRYEISIRRLPGEQAS